MKRLMASAALIGALMVPAVASAQSDSGCPQIQGSGVQCIPSDDSSPLVYVTDPPTQSVQTGADIVNSATPAYSLTLTRMGVDLYRDAGSGILVQTSNCLELATYDQAVVVWNGTMGAAAGNQVIWQDGTNCTIDGIYRS